MRRHVCDRYTDERFLASELLRPNSYHAEDYQHLDGFRWSSRKQALDVPLQSAYSARQMNESVLRMANGQSKVRPMPARRARAPRTLSRFFPPGAQEYAACLHALMRTNRHMLKCMLTHTEYEDEEDCVGFLTHTLVWILKICVDKARQPTGFAFGKCLDIPSEDPGVCMHDEVTVSPSCLLLPRATRCARVLTSAPRRQISTTTWNQLQFVYLPLQPFKDDRFLRSSVALVYFCSIDDRYFCANRTCRLPQCVEMRGALLADSSHAAAEAEEGGRTDSPGPGPLGGPA